MKRRVTTNGKKFSYQYKFMCWWHNTGILYDTKEMAQRAVDRLNRLDEETSKPWSPIDEISNMD